MQYHLKATGSNGSTYNVIFVHDKDNNPRLLCDCSAGMRGLLCKHRSALLEKIPDEIYSDLDAFKEAVSLLETAGLTDEYVKHKKILDDLDKESKKIKKSQDKQKQTYINLLEGSLNKDSAFEPYSLGNLL